MIDKQAASARKSRTKGKVGEREVVAILTAAGISSRRGLSQSRGGGAEEPDIVIDLPYHIEVKRQARPLIMAAYEQAAADAAQGRAPVAVTRCDRGEWMATLRLEVFAALLRAAHYQDRL